MFYLTLQHTYTHIEYALCNDQQIVRTTSDDKLHASKHIILTFQELLTQHNLKLSDLSFMVVNQGPGPFTTLRTSIATANGIAFASHLPLVAVNGLEALVTEYSSPDYPYTVALLNAFGHDLYYGISTNGGLDIGCANYKKMLSDIQGMTKNNNVLFVGNGAEMYQDAIKVEFKDNAIFPNPIPQTVSIKQIARLGYKYWQEQRHIFKQIEPLYLKIQY